MPTKKKKSPPLKWHSLATKALSLADNVLSLLVHVDKLNSPRGLVTLGVRGAQVLASQSGRVMDPLHNFKGLPWDGALNTSVFEVLRERKAIREVSGVYEAKVEGRYIYWASSDNGLMGPFIHPEEDEEACLEALRTCVWDHFDSQIYISSSGEATFFRKDPLRKKPAYGSKKADELWEEIQLLREGDTETDLEEEGGLSYLLYGPSGAGKTTAARYLSKKAGGRCLRIKVKGIDHLVKGLSIIEDLKPSAICIDDIDRCQGSPLEVLDTIKAVCSLLLVTANTISGLDPALLRPSRFDEVVFFESLEDDAYAKLFEGLPEQDQARLRELPIAYVKHYRRSFEKLGEERARAKLDALVKRAETVQEMFAKIEAKAGKNPSAWGLEELPDGMMFAEMPPEDMPFEE